MNDDDPVPAGDPSVRKGRWIHCPDAPSGWFRITAVWRSADGDDRDIHIAVNGRGAHYRLDYRPDDEVRLGSSAGG